MENTQQKDFSAWECILYDGDNKSKKIYQQLKDEYAV